MLQPLSHTQLLLLEDTAAIIRIVIEAISPNLRQVGRTLRIDLDELFERINLDLAIPI